MSPSARLVSLLCLASLSPMAHAATLTAPERRCQATAASTGRRLFDSTLTLLASCQRDVARGARPPGTDCQSDAAVLAARAAAAQRLTRKIPTACASALPSLRPGGDCAGATTAAAFASCLAGSHDAGAASLIAATDAASAPVAADARSCREVVTARTRKLAQARLSTLQACKQRPPARLPAGGTCATFDPVAKRLARLATRTTSAIAEACPGTTLATAGLGPECAAVPDVAACLVATVAAATDALLDAEYRDGAFCGDSADAVDKRVDKFLAQMTLDEKLSQMHGSSLTSTGWRTPEVERVDLPGFGMFDGPRGVSNLGGAATAFPVGIARAATWDPALEERVGDAIGVEMRAKGANVLLAPTINVLHHPRGGRAQESYGEDSFLMGEMAVGFVRGAQHHLIANPKHFALNNVENTRFTMSADIDERSLREVYLPHFRAAVVRGHAASVMSAYNKVNGQYCSENVHLLHDVLKGDWGFQGFVESDWFGSHTTVPSTVAGLDIEMPFGNIYGASLTTAVGNGTVPTSVVDDAVRRSLRARFCLRLDTDPPVVDATRIALPETVALALDVARESVVLLKNAASALPIDRGTTSAIAVVGSLADTVNIGDNGSSSVTPIAPVTVKAGIENRAGGVGVTYVPALTLPLSPEDQATISTAAVAVVVVGLTKVDEGEGAIGAGDRTSLVLPRAQDDLVAAVAALNPRTVVILEGSGPVTMPWLADVPAVLTAWYPGVQGGNAVADVLFGDVVPSGKLPMSFPVAEADLPPFDNVSLSVTYDLFHGYRYLDRHDTAPLFPFGHGLSYTTFSYANLHVTPAAIPANGRVRITADVTNTGSRAGTEIAQLYVGAEGSTVDRAVKELKGFARVHLEPGETRTAVFELRAADLAYWNTATNGWTVEPISYRLRVGGSSGDLPLDGSVSIAP